MDTKRLPSARPTNSWHEDEFVEELHRHRADVAERFDYDLERMYEYCSSVPIDPEAPLADIRPVTPTLKKGR